MHYLLEDEQCTCTLYLNWCYSVLVLVQFMLTIAIVLVTAIEAVVWAVAAIAAVDAGPTVTLPLIIITLFYRTHNINIIVLEDTQYQYHRPTGHTISSYWTHNINISISSSYRTHNIVLLDTQYQYHRSTGHMKDWEVNWTNSKSNSLKWMKMK